MRTWDSSWFSFCGITDDGALLKSIQHLQQALVQEDFATYPQQKAFVQAYSAYYLPTNYPKLDFLLGRLGPLWQTYLSKMQFIDFGCGPGTFSLAWADAFSEERPRCLLFDKAPLMLEMAQKILSSLHNPDRFQYFSNLAQLAAALDDGPRCLFFGHSLVEHAATLNWPSIFKMLRPEVILLIEPGTKSSFANLKTWRQWPQENGYKLAYPCLGPHPCPLAPDDWCHQVMHYTQPAPWQRLGQKLGLDRNVLPLIAQAWIKDEKMWEVLNAGNPTSNGHSTAVSSSSFSPSSPPSDLQRGRLLRVWGEDKAYFRWQLCWRDGHQFRLPKVEVAKRHLAKEQQKAWHHLDAGRLIYFRVVKINGNQTWRIEVEKVE